MKSLECVLFYTLVMSVLLLPIPGIAIAPSYDPLALSNNDTVTTVDLAVSDSQRNRKIPIRIYLPAKKEASPIVLFSHGLGGSREGSAYLGKHWAGRGYVAVFLQHIGSDESVWKDTQRNKRLGALQDAITLENTLLRIKDVTAVLDQLERWNREDGHILEGRLDPEHIGMSGHSYGAVTTQTVSGQRGVLGASLTDPRIDAAVIMSPSSPRRGVPERAFGKVDLPWLLMTGTKDVAVVGDADMDSRLAVFPALPPGGKYELVLYNAEHSAFSDRGLPGDKETRNPNHHHVILALSTAFWDTYLRDDDAARKWLDGDGPKSILGKKDTWQKK